MTIAQVKSIPITDWLSLLGHQKVFTRKGYEDWYRSPFRKEKTPSFKVDRELNSWTDFGLVRLYHDPGRIGGNILDFARHYRLTNNIREALKFLRELNNNKFTNFPQASSGYSKKAILAKRKKQEDSRELIKVRSLQNIALLDYIAKRKIDTDIAKMYLQECYYRCKSRPGKTYFAVCMQNNGGAYELRSKYIKGIINGGKDVTTFKHDEHPYLNIFEGFMDFLSLLTIQKKKSLEGTTIVLHSTVMVKKAIWYAKNYESKKITAWLDNDEAGESAFEQLGAALPAYTLLRGNDLYRHHKDLNDYLMFLRG